MSETVQPAAKPPNQESPWQTEALNHLLARVADAAPLKTIAIELQQRFAESPPAEIAAFIQDHERDVVAHMNAVACKRHEGHYTHPYTGYLVFSSHYHRTRGYCCENGCLHCPFGMSPLGNDA